MVTCNQSGKLKLMVIMSFYLPPPFFPNVMALAWICLVSKVCLSLPSLPPLSTLWKMKETYEKKKTPDYHVFMFNVQFDFFLIFGSSLEMYPICHRPPVVF